jgi:hypothetical protein
MDQRKNGRIINLNRKRRRQMKAFILGVVVTLAVLYPSVTKVILGNTIDTTHSVVTNVIDQNK